jgi:hypothetical protein
MWSKRDAVGICPENECYSSSDQQKQIIDFCSASKAQKSCIAKVLVVLRSTVWCHPALQALIFKGRDRARKITPGGAINRALKKKKKNNF